MKNTLILLFVAFCSLTANAQESKRRIDYQYNRSDKGIYAYELFTIGQKAGSELMINFSFVGDFNKVNKIKIVAEGVEIKVKFKMRDDVVKSDNPKQKFYPIVFDVSQLSNKKEVCSGTIFFELDNGINCSLPFDLCKALSANVKS